MQRFGHTSCKASIPIISILFVENVYLLLENISTLIKTTISKDNEILVKTSLFWDKTVTVS